MRENPNNQAWITSEIVTLANEHTEHDRTFWEDLKSEVQRQIKLNLARKEFKLTQDLTKTLVGRIYEKMDTESKKPMSIQQKIEYLGDSDLLI